MLYLLHLAFLSPPNNDWYRNLLDLFSPSGPMVVLVQLKATMTAAAAFSLVVFLD